MSNRRDFFWKRQAGWRCPTIVPRMRSEAPNSSPRATSSRWGIIGVAASARVAIISPPTMHAAWWRSATSTANTSRKRHRAGPQEVRQDPRKLSRLPGSDHRPQRRHRTHATLPHWHGIMAVRGPRPARTSGARKPLTRTIGEGSAWWRPSGRTDASSA